MHRFQFSPRKSAWLSPDLSPIIGTDQHSSSVFNTFLVNHSVFLRGKIIFFSFILFLSTLSLSLKTNKIITRVDAINQRFLLIGYTDLSLKKSVRSLIYPFFVILLPRKLQGRIYIFASLNEIELNYLIVNEKYRIHDLKIERIIYSNFLNSNFSARELNAGENVFHDSLLAKRRNPILIIL